MDVSKDQPWTPPADWTLEHRLIWDLGFFGHYMHVNMGGRSGKKRILTRLSKHGGCMDQRTLQESFDIKSGSLSEVLAKLEAEGFVERRRSEEDARKLVVVLTPAGTERAQEYQRESQEFERNALSCLSLEERAALLETLDRLIDHWNDLEPMGGTSSTERKGE